MAFISQAVTVLQTLVIALGAGLAVWGVVNLMEGYGNDNPGANAHVPSTTMSLRPRLRIVSIIPGIDARAPERTDTNNGFAGSPNVEFIKVSMFFTAACTSALRSSITFSLPRL